MATSGVFRVPLPRLGFDSVQKPGFFFGARRVDNFRADRLFGDEFGHQQRNNRTSEADDGGIRQQAARAAPAVDAQNRQNNVDYDQNSDIGSQKQKNSFHGCSFLVGCDVLKFWGLSQKVAGL
ncbi:Uncharacterised protein [Neisseria meningitidis]|nr:Uncharacterised protein [Neisseria meningitidis]